MNLMLLYLFFINLLSGIIFAFDKNAAIKEHRRIQELTLHILELLGGVFVNLLLMYSLHHKNRKFSYYIWTWLVGIVWILVLLKTYLLNQIIY